jgi:hypothetical protein
VARSRPFQSPWPYVGALGLELYGLAKTFFDEDLEELLGSWILAVRIGLVLVVVMTVVTMVMVLTGRWAPEERASPFEREDREWDEIRAGRTVRRRARRRREDEPPPA